MKIDATPAYPMKCSKVDEPSINAAALAIEVMPPGDLAIELAMLAGIVRRGEIVDGARVVAALRAAARFLTK